jgi:hypothetical protein
MLVTYTINLGRVHTWFDDLECHLAFDRSFLLRQIDHPEPALSQHAQQLVAPDTAAELIQGLARIQSPRGILILLSDMVIDVAHENSPTISPFRMPILPEENLSGHKDKLKAAARAVPGRRRTRDQGPRVWGELWPALNISAAFSVFASTDGRREASCYGEMIASGYRL